MHVIGVILAIGLAVLPQEIDDLSPQTMEAISAWQECMDASVSRLSRSSDSAEAAADGVLEYCRDQQRTVRAALSVDLHRSAPQEAEELTNSTETILAMRARQNIVSQIAAARQQ